MAREYVSYAGLLIPAGSIPTAAVADGAITTVKLGAGSVDSTKLAAGASLANLAAASVDSTKLAAGAAQTNLGATPTISDPRIGVSYNSPNSSYYFSWGTGTVTLPSPTIGIVRVFKAWTGTLTITASVGSAIYPRGSTSVTGGVASLVLRDGQTAEMIADGAQWWELGPSDDLAWTPFTPTMTQGVAITITNTSSFKRLGKKVDLTCSIGISSAGTATSLIVVTLPAAVPAIANLGYHCAGAGLYFHSGVAWYPVIVVPAGPRTLEFMRSGVQANGGTPNYMGPDVTGLQLTSGDQMNFTITYQTPDA